MNELNSVQQLGNSMSLDEVCYYPPFGDMDFLFCAEVPVVSQEFFNAGMQDIKAEKSLVVDAESFIAADSTLGAESKNRLKYKGKVYAIYRQYPIPATSLMQLNLTTKAGVK